MIKTINKIFRITRPSPQFGQELQMQQVLDEVASKKVVIFGETHSNKVCCDMQH